jgi:Ca2+-binding RTX toxin-like protein
VFHRAFDFANVDLAEFFGGTVTPVSLTEIHVAQGKFSAVLSGSFVPGFPPSGTLNTVEASYKNLPLFTASNMNVPLGDVIANADDGDALLGLFFGGADTFKGSKGADVLYSHDGADVLSGGKGTDVVIGGAGADTMTGGADADTFVYLAANDSTKKVADLITDLNDAGDFINLQALTLESLDQITAVYNESKDRTAFTIDVNGEALMFITADGDHTGFDNFII